MAGGYHTGQCSQSNTFLQSRCPTAQRAVVPCSQNGWGMLTLQGGWARSCRTTLYPSVLGDQFAQAVRMGREGQMASL